ncbi:MAG TPA: phosphatidate cytidylyltransferase [Armatimonadota bacterium]|jgi:phosphatidate cytidylyltransferase
MMTRILTSLVGVPLILVLLFWPGGWPWFFFVAAVMAMAIYEFTKALWAKGIYVHWIALAFFGVLAITRAAPALMGLEGRIGLERPLMFVIGGSVFPEFAALFVMLLLAGDLLWKRRSPLKNVGATFLGMGWIALTLPFLVDIRRVGQSAANHTVLPDAVTPPLGAQEGAWLMFAVLLVIWAGDSGAYFVGKAIGRHKMAPGISPNKTWEGSVGGLAASWIVGMAMTWPLALNPLTCLLFGLVVGAVGQVGDLVESAIKREIGIKDFGDLLPGHGGVLDRFDSLIFAAPVAFFILYPGGVVRFLR